MLLALKKLWLPYSLKRFNESHRKKPYMGRKRMHDFFKDERFKGIEKFDKKVWLSSPTMHGDEQKWVDEAIQTNWVSTVGANLNEVEKIAAAFKDFGFAYAALDLKGYRTGSLNETLERKRPWAGIQ